jgi:hypothetical protein
LNIGSFWTIEEEETTNSGERLFTYPVPEEIMLILEIEEANET